MFNNNGYFTIAEIGGNHEGDFRQAKYLVEEAINSPVDAIKLQLYTGDTLVNKQIDAKRNAHFKGFELSESENRYLLELIRRSGKIAGASIWHESLLTKYASDCDFLKIGSGDITDTSLIRKCLDYNKPLVASTGLTTANQLSALLTLVKDFGSNEFALLHCRSLYPTYTDELDLKCIETLRQAILDAGILGCAGYSHHHVNHSPILWAAAMGAQVFEFHFSSQEFDRSAFRDHHISLNRQDTIKLVADLKMLQRSLGDGNIRPNQAEVDTGHVKSFRKAVYLNKEIQENQIITADDLVCLRPYQGLCASKLSNLIGKKAKRTLKAFEPLEEDCFSEK